LGLPGQLDAVPVVLVLKCNTNRPHAARRPLLGPLLSIQMRSDWAPGGHANNPDVHTRAPHPSHGYMRYPLSVLCCVGCVGCLYKVSSVYPRNSGNQNTALLARGPDHVSVRTLGGGHKMDTRTVCLSDGRRWLTQTSGTTPMTSLSHGGRLVEGGIPILRCHLLGDDGRDAPQMVDPHVRKCHPNDLANPVGDPDNTPDK
jgi:hypothetical protein